jgi:two-component system, cell cycle response regulator DivK
MHPTKRSPTSVKQSRYGFFPIAPAGPSVKCFAVTALFGAPRPMGRVTSRRIPTVLLVENFADDRQMYAEYLRRQRYRVIEIDDTGDALQMAPSCDVVVTGILVCGPFDGLELVRRLRAADNTRNKAIVVLTACALESDRQHSHEAGCDAYLPKPCLPDALAAEIRRTLVASATRARPVPARSGGKRKHIVA